MYIIAFSCRMTELTDFERLAKRLRVEPSAKTSSTFAKGNLAAHNSLERLLQRSLWMNLRIANLCNTLFLLFSTVLSSCFQRKENETVDQEKKQNNTKIEMDVRPKTAGNGLRGVKTKGHQRIDPKQKQKFRNTLIQQWLVKPSNNPSPTDVHQSLKDVKMTEDCDFHSTSAQSLDCQKPILSDSDEETQPLTPQFLDECSPVSQASKEKQEIETSPISTEGSVKQNTKITDFFSKSATLGFPVRRSRPEKGVADKESSPDVRTDVKWLGTPIGELKRLPKCGGPLPTLKDVPGVHTVMIRVCIIFSFTIHSLIRSILFAGFCHPAFI